MSLESILKATGKNKATQVVNPELIKGLITISSLCILYGLEVTLRL